jgi:hypothetical protein
MHVHAAYLDCGGSVKEDGSPSMAFAAQVSVAAKSTACHASQSLMVFRQFSVERL